MVRASSQSGGLACLLPRARCERNAVTMSVAAQTALLPHSEGCSRVGRELVRRPRLVERLVAARDGSLVVIVAPPGYGKTTLLREWNERDERPFIWLRLADLASESTATIAEALEQADAFVLVVDDAHSVSRLQLRASLMPLLGELPYGSALAIAPAPSPRCQSAVARPPRAGRGPHGGSGDDRAEAAMLLRRAGIELIPSRSRHSHTGPKVAGGPIPGGAVPARRCGAAPAVCGRRPLLAEYFRDEVLAPVPPDLNELPCGPRCSRSFRGRCAMPCSGHGVPLWRSGGWKRRASCSWRSTRSRPVPVAAAVADALRAESAGQSRSRARLQRARAPGTRRTEIWIRRSPTRSRRATPSARGSCCGPASSSTSLRAAPPSFRGGSPASATRRSRDIRRSH